MRFARYNPPQQMFFKRRLFFAGMALVCLLSAWIVPAAQAANWEQPAADLARQIAALAGPGPARLIVLNHSTLAISEIPAIRRLLERDLRGYGVVAGTADSATQIRVTLSQNQDGGLWVAEVVEGSESRVAMLPVALGSAAVSPGGPNLTLRRTLIFSQPAQILDAAVMNIAGVPLLIVLEPDRIATYTRNANSFAAISTGPAATIPEWRESQSFPVAHTRPYPRDPRGRLLLTPEHAPNSTSDQVFAAYLPGVVCSGAGTGLQLAVSCSDSDDPWPISETQRAFYNSTRDFFTGVLAPGYGLDLAPFYQAAEIPRATGPALLLANTDGRVVLIENGTVKPLTGTADWGSDLALIRSNCGSGAQLLVSGSGSAAAGDSLRAYEISGREAVPVSGSVTVDGAIVGLHSAANPATMIVRRSQPGGSESAWEVWDVAAVCN